MQVLAVLFGTLLLYKILGAAGVLLFGSWTDSASSHWWPGAIGPLLTFERLQFKAGPL
jgi:hypothetical protein